MFAQLVTGRFSTSVYTFEKFDTVDVSKVFARGFQTLQLGISEGDVSLNTSLYGVSNLSRSFGDNVAIRINNLFLRWRNIANTVDVNVGRVPIFAGVGNGTVDGALIKARGWDKKIVLSTYGGTSVLSDIKSTGFEDVDKNFFIGGQLIGSFVNNFRFGLSYMNRHIQRESYTALRPDSLFNSIPVLVAPDSRAEQALGVDARYGGSSMLSVYGRYDYDLNFKRSRRVQGHVRFTVTEQIGLTAEYNYREPRIAYNSFFRIFPTSPIREYEGGIEYSSNSSIRASGKFAYVKYSRENSKRFIAGIYTDYGSARFSGTDGYAGELSSVDIQGMYPLFNRVLIPTVGFSFASYRLEAAQIDREDILAGSLGAVVRPIPDISGDVQVQWLRNTVAENDVRLYAKLNYWFSHNLDLFNRNEVGK
ncbi:MAG: hypothetical protein HY707_14470 [Ignavibacteriae bacterium]|nr:hypothetical protein [Ignavibacteriota bacterium]